MGPADGPVRALAFRNGNRTNLICTGNRYQNGIFVYKSRRFGRYPPGFKRYERKTLARSVFECTNEFCTSAAGRKKDRGRTQVFLTFWSSSFCCLIGKGVLLGVMYVTRSRCKTRPLRPSVDHFTRSRCKTRLLRPFVGQFSRSRCKTRLLRPFVGQFSRSRCKTRPLRPFVDQFSRLRCKTTPLRTYIVHSTEQRGILPLCEHISFAQVRASVAGRLAMCANSC